MGGCMRPCLREVRELVGEDQESWLGKTRRAGWGRPGELVGEDQESWLGKTRRDGWGRPGELVGEDQESWLGKTRRAGWGRPGEMCWPQSYTAPKSSESLWMKSI
ncbi:unnamed protein product [Coregonus sp. 'balchen']|nr:unnamed protein product [Coregonus sp. 'balchen']